MNTPTIHTAFAPCLTRASALLAFAAVTGCGTNLTPTLVDVAGQAVELVEAGSGDATVVFESGLGNDWSTWDPLATEVAAQARVFAYSRPGYGGSAPTTRPRDATHIVEELRALLAARGYAPPYVLVGHSFGGTYMELFAKRYPEEVKGLVLVETRHRNFTALCEAAGIQECIIPDSVVASLPDVERAEYRAFQGAADEIAATAGFGSYPVRVLTATSHGFDAETEALWVSTLGALADEAPDGEQVVYSGAGHYLQSERVREVAEVILTVGAGD